MGVGGNIYWNGVFNPSKRKGILKINDRRKKINCPIKNNVRIRKSNNIPSRENKPRLLPDDRKPTTTIKI